MSIWFKWTWSLAIICTRVCQKNLESEYVHVQFSHRFSLHLVAVVPVDLHVPAAHNCGLWARAFCSGNIRLRFQRHAAVGIYKMWTTERQNRKARTEAPKWESRTKSRGNTHYTDSFTFQSFNIIILCKLPLCGLKNHKNHNAPSSSEADWSPGKPSPAAGE